MPRTKIEKADLAVARAAKPARAKRWVKLLGSLSELADQPPLISLCGATFAIGLATGNRRLASAGGRMLAAELVATAIKSAIKHRVDRTRPRVVADGGDYRRRKGNAKTSALSSFPSGHTAGAVAVARALTRDYPLGAAPAFATAAGVAAIQVPRSQHYVSDVVAGALLGLAAEAIVFGAERLLADALPPRDPPPQPGSTPAVIASDQ